MGVTYVPQLSSNDLLQELIELKLQRATSVSLHGNKDLASSVRA